MVDVTVNTLDVRQALASVVAHAAASTSDDDRLVRVRLEVTAQNVVVTATQGYTCGLAIVAVLENGDGELGTWDMSPGACKDVLAMFKVSKELADDAALRFRVNREHVDVQDVGGLFPGKAITLGRLPDHDQFPDVSGIVGQTVHAARWAFDEGMATSGPWWSTFVAATKAYRETVYLSAARQPNGRPKLLVQVGESFIGLLMASADPDMVNDLKTYRDRDWPNRLPTHPARHRDESMLRDAGVTIITGSAGLAAAADLVAPHLVRDDDDTDDTDDTDGADDFGGDES